LRQTFVVKAKKSYGQHFLTNEHYAQKIADSLSLDGTYAGLLEVGPGQGVLTKYLVAKGLPFKAVDADADMLAYLRAHHPDWQPFLILEDFLKLPLPGLFPEPFAIIGNFPYNISSQILIKTIDYRDIIPELVGMFQKEVAERVVAAPGSKVYGILSVLVQAWYTTEYLFTVSSGNFNPPPKVQSAVIRLRRKGDPLVADEDAALFRQVVKMAFGQRRKMLRNTLRSLLPEADPLLDQPFFQQRPEQLSIADFVKICRWIKERRKD
jgi:16S rRNA (adenine1518-N6/adenine1519-N6)-dimethyltransferase